MTPLVIIRQTVLFIFLNSLAVFIQHKSPNTSDFYAKTFATLDLFHSLIMRRKNAAVKDRGLMWASASSPSLPLTLPAGPDRQLHVDLRGVDGPVVRHQVGVVGHAVHVQRHHRELHVDDVVMPFLVTDLRTGERNRDRINTGLFVVCLLLSEV